VRCVALCVACFVALCVAWSVALSVAWCVALFVALFVGHPSTTYRGGDAVCGGI